MKVAITLAGGQLGTAVIDHLKRKVKADNIVGIARTPSKIKHHDIEVRKGDYDNPLELEKAFQGIDTVLLISGMAPPEQRVIQHKNVIEAAQKNGIKKIVFTGIIGDETKTSFSSLVIGSKQTEEDIKHSSLEWAIGRNALYIEADLEYLETYKSAGEISNSAGNGLCTYTTREELAEAYSNLLLKKCTSRLAFLLALLIVLCLLSLIVVHRRNLV